MQLTVSVTADLPANGTVDTVAPLVVAAGQQAMRAAMQAAGAVAVTAPNQEPARRLVAQLEGLGYRVTLDRRAA